MANAGRMTSGRSGSGAAASQPLRSLFACWWLLPLLIALCAPLVAVAQAVLPVPALSARVIDQTGTLDASQIAALQQQLAALEQDKGAQVVVLMVPTTAPEDIASYANRVASQGLRWIHPLPVH